MDDIAEKKQAIFESTLSLIREHGFHGAPMSLVAKNAGVAAGTIYHYFHSKDQLICELYHYNRTRVAAAIDKALSTSGTYKERFFTTWLALYKFYTKEPNVLTFFEQFVNSPFNTDKFPNHFRGALYTFFAEATKAGVVRPLKPEILLVLIMGSITATAKLHLFAKVSLTKGDLLLICETLWDGISHRKKNS